MKMEIMTIGGVVLIGAGGLIAYWAYGDFVMKSYWKLIGRVTVAGLLIYGGVSIMGAGTTAAKESAKEEITEKISAVLEE
tara:strand:+ start:255 stop:494 length:240 start_codon:yes stop_codon:yes gene_type:complete